MPNTKSKLSIRDYESPEEYRKRLLRNAKRNLLLQDERYVKRLVKIAMAERAQSKAGKILAARARTFKPEYDAQFDDIRKILRILTNQRHYCARMGETDGLDLCNEFMRLLRKTRTVMKTRHRDGLLPKHWSEVLDNHEWRSLRDMHGEMIGGLAKRFNYVIEQTTNPRNYIFQYRKPDSRIALIAGRRRTGKPNEILCDSHTDGTAAPQSSNKGESHE